MQKIQRIGLHGLCGQSVSHPSPDISPVRIHIINKEVGKFKVIQFSIFLISYEIFMIP
jgi:hypothetical protein